MAIRTRSSDGYQQVELTSELLHGQSGATQQVISTVPCSKHLPFFLSILLADVLTFGAVLTFAVYAAQHADGFSYERQPDAPLRQFNLHALVMLVAFVYLNGQAITAYKSNYLVKHKSVNVLYHFLLHLLTLAAALGGLYLTYSAQETIQADRPRVAHLYSLHSWAALVTLGLFAVQFLFGFGSFFVTLCCRKLTARMRAGALPVHRVLAMVVLCSAVATVISGLSQLARFELTGQAGRADYREIGWPGALINLSGVCVLLSTVLLFFITFIFKRRQAHDLPAMFKVVLLVAQFIELVLILVVAEFVFQLVTPHVHKAINTQLIGNHTFGHILNNATASIQTFISAATQHITGAADANATTTTTTDSSAASAASSTEPPSSILLGTTGAPS